MDSTSSLYLKESTSALQVATESWQERHCQLSYCCWRVSSIQLGGGRALGVGSTPLGAKQRQRGQYSCQEAVEEEHNLRRLQLCHLVHLSHEGEVESRGRRRKGGGEEGDGGDPRRVVSEEEGGKEG